MVEIVEVSTKQLMKKFVEFPLNLYKDNPYYVPPFYGDEYKLFFPKKSVFAENSKSKFFLAYKDGKIAGRIAGLIVQDYINKTGRKVMRFSRIDFIDDKEVSKALFSAVENFAKQEGLNELQGPMGYTDTDREGLLIEGFDKISTYAENYSYSYYVDHFESYGFEKEVDWLEYKLEVPQQLSEKMVKISALVEKRYKLREVATPGISVAEIISKYGDSVFDVLNAAYEPLHGTIPLKGRVKDDIIQQFKIFLHQEYISLVVNEKDELVAFGVVLPSISKELIRSRGKLTLPSIIRLIRIRNRPKAVEFAIIAVRPDYHNKGVNAMIINKIHKGLIKKGVTVAETNLELETNTAVQSQWDGFNKEFIKRRRCFLKSID